jgi:hypothetical protein
MDLMDKWCGFYFLCGSSAAGLTGLIFIAVTFGEKVVRKDNLDAVNLFLTSICFHFIEVFLLCCIATVPTAGSKVTGVAMMVFGLWRLVCIPKSFATMKETAKQDEEIEFSDWLFFLTFPALSQIGFVVTGILYLMNSSVAQNFFALNLVALLAIGICAAWDMVVWLATQIDVVRSDKRTPRRASKRPIARLTPESVIPSQP